MALIEAMQAGEYLMATERNAYRWLQARLKKNNDEILDWQLIAQGEKSDSKSIIWLTLSGFNIVMSRGSNPVLSQDAETRSKIIKQTKASGESLKILVPDALNPLKIINWRDLDPDGSVVWFDARFLLRKKDEVEEHEPIIIEVAHVFEEGWYQRALFSVSHTAIRDK